MNNSKKTSPIELDRNKLNVSEGKSIKKDVVFYIKPTKLHVSEEEMQRMIDRKYRR